MRIRRRPVSTLPANGAALWGLVTCSACVACAAQEDLATCHAGDVDCLSSKRGKTSSAEESLLQRDIGHDYQQMHAGEKRQSPPSSEADDEQVSKDLLFAFPIVQMNLTNYSALISVGPHVPHPGVSHSFGCLRCDEDLLFESVEGFFDVLHTELPDEDRVFCPKKNVSVIQRCVEMALCMLQGAIGSDEGDFNIETYTLLEEIQARFDEISWPLLWEALQKESPTPLEESLEIPASYACDAAHDDEDAALLQATATGHKTRLKAAYHASLVLQKSEDVTHRVLDAHMHNTSVEVTLQGLYNAWNPVCELLGCDHTNYYDVIGASHAHSLALIEAGASARHMRAQIRSRVKLENRIQRFLSDHGESMMARMYRPEATDADMQMLQYVATSRGSLMRFVSSFVSAQGPRDALLGLLNKDRLNEYFADRGLDDQFRALWDARHATGNETASLVSTSWPWDRRRRRSRRRRRRRRRRRGGFWGDVGRAASSAVNTGATAAESAVNTVASAVNTGATAAESAVNTVAAFVEDLFECFGQWKTMAATGYCKKFELGPWPAGIGFSMIARGSRDLMGNLMNGIPGGAVSLTIGMVVGAVPGTPVDGGLRTGVGVSGSLSCSGSCNLAISVGTVASALVPTSGTGCLFGSWVEPFRCMVGAGFSISTLCCSFNPFTGSENCR